LSEINNTNFIVCAKFWFKVDKFEGKFLSQINNIISEYMSKEGFETEDYREILLGQPLFVMTFYAKLHYKTPTLTMRFQKLIGFKTQEEIDNMLYFDVLRNTMEEYPAKVTFIITHQNIKNDVNGYIINIETEPIIVSKIRRLYYKPKLDQTKYNNIIEYQKAFIKRIMACWGGGSFLEEPHVINPLEIKQKNYLFEEEFLILLPKEVKVCLIEANKCYSIECYRATSIMIRKAIEIAIIKKFYQTKNESRLYGENGEEIPLKSKLKLLREIAPYVNKNINDIELVKWFGDYSAHDPNSLILVKDIEQNTPKTRAFLINLKLK